MYRRKEKIEQALASGILFAARVDSERRPTAMGVSRCAQESSWYFDDFVNVLCLNDGGTFKRHLEDIKKSL